MIIKGFIFDIGGVLLKTVQEHMFFDPQKGVIDRYSLNRDKTAKIVAHLWQKYAYETIDTHDWRELENRYWQEFNQAMGLNISLSEYNAITDEFIVPIVGMQAIIRKLQRNNFDLLIFSNNCEFWWQRERQKMTLDTYFKPNKIILSHHFGKIKSGKDIQMFNILENAMDYSKGHYVYIDDQWENLKVGIKFCLTGIPFPTDSPE